MRYFDRVENYMDGVLDNLRFDVERCREIERARERELERMENERNEVAGVARVLNVDFNASNNAVKHKCDKYELVHQKKGSPVLRRGGTFSIDLELSRDIDVKKEYNLRLFFNFGHAPSVHNGTQAILNVSGKTMLDKNHETWDVRVEGTDKKLITLEVQIPSSAPVGLWKMALELKPRNPKADPSSRQIMRLPTNIYILFNPWNKHDGAYMPEEEQREEYVLTDVGKIWMGGVNTGRHWVFGQFDDAVLPACVFMLERSGLQPDSRGDPVMVSRYISKMVNSNDDNGVLEGKWKGFYTDGTAPTEWTGSIKILELYMRSGRSVKYGQCWVFAGVVNTVCRALGLPARVVTNLDSAHDTDVSLTIDEYIDENGDKIESSNGYGNNLDGIEDSIWNYHVWNDVWMDRPDLPPGYGGWQAIDATPQEKSDGAYMCGPASHEAIRRGQMEHKYDVPFVLAEVNADVVHWQEDPTAQDGFRKIFSNKIRVGRHLLTKKMGQLEDGRYSGRDYEDLKSLYKPPEGSKAERVTLQGAARMSRNARHAFRLPSEALDDVNFSIVDIDRIMIGEDFSVTIKAENQSEMLRTVSIVLKAGSTYYTGAPAHLITEVGGEFKLQPGESKTQVLPVKYSQYYSKLVEHSMIKVVSHCRVQETTYVWVGDDCFEVAKPDIKVEVLEKAVVGQPFKALFSFINPLPVTLKNCILVVDGPGLSRPKRILMNDVRSKDKMQWDQPMVPYKSGQHVLVATFNSTQLENLTGSVKVLVS